MDTIRADTRRKRREREVAAPETLGDRGLRRIEELDTRAVVERELQELPLDQREVLVLRLLAERSYREIAEITGKKIGTVGWLISEGVRALGGEVLNDVVFTQVSTTWGDDETTLAVEQALVADGETWMTG